MKIKEFNQKEERFVGQEVRDTKSGIVFTITAIEFPFIHSTEGQFNIYQVVNASTGEPLVDPKLNPKIDSIELKEKRMKEERQLRSIIRRIIKEYMDDEISGAEDGIDSSYDKLHGDLLNVQKDMVRLLKLLKLGKMTKDQYIAKRKMLQNKRNNFEKQL